MKKKALVLILFFLLIGSIYGTAQLGDFIIYKGKKYLLFTNPLEYYFNKFSDKRPKSGIVSTNLWRGYVATFYIKESSLYLKDIKIRCVKKSKKNSYKWVSVVNEVFPNKKEIKAKWFSGNLIIPHGKRLKYVHMAYRSLYENYIVLKIENGVLKKEMIFTYKEFIKYRDKKAK